MRALVYHGPGKRAWDQVPDPEITDEGDAIVRVDATTICGTDLHILAGDLPEVRPGRILGHEAVGTVDEVGQRCPPALGPATGCLSRASAACGSLPATAGEGRLRPVHRRRRLDPRPPRRRHPGRIRPGPATPTTPPTGSRTARQRRGRSSCSPTSSPPGTRSACSAGGVRPGDVVAVVGAGPIGLSAIACARLFSPSHVVAIDLSDEPARSEPWQFGADVTVQQRGRRPGGRSSAT